MNLGFVSAILPDQDLEEVFEIASSIGYQCVEVMCWPHGRADRRYAGITHIDVADLSASTILSIHGLQDKYGVSISGLGYYGNPLTSDHVEGAKQIQHIYKTIDAAQVLGVGIVNTFVGRDHHLSVADNWPRFLEVWRPIVNYAASRDIKIGIENCPMSFTADEWPGGKNMATTPAILRKMYVDIPHKTFGLNYDPSHMIIQHMSTTAPIMEFCQRLHHVHAKDCKIDREALDQHGVFAFPNLWHIPKLPGRGDVDWKLFFETLRSVGYEGAVCVEVEDREYEGDLQLRMKALQDSYDYLHPLVNC